MGGKLSNMFGKSQAEEDEEKLRKYQEQIDSGGTFIGAEEDKKEVARWERLIFDKRARITYVVILGIILGIVIPVIIFATMLKKEDKPIYGSCLIKQNARFQCLVNSKEPATEDECVRALCCWENSNALQFKCYHSFPSAYQYNVSSTAIQSDNMTTWTNLQLKTSHPELMSPVRVITHWKSEEHLVVEIFNSDKFPTRNSPKELTKGKNNGIDQSDETLPFTISWGEDEHFFFLRIARRETDETIFDTRLGPVYATGEDITLATLLPTEFFYGLKGGQGLVSSLTYGIVNGFENSEFPFYISFEDSGQWHGVLIDTSDPILAQVVPAPGIMFVLETDQPEINLHFFAGPTQPQILAQLHAFIQETNEITTLPMIPPYWGLGLHLCRKVENSSVVLTHLEQLLHENKTIAFDSDCIDEDLRHPIFLDEPQFAPDLKTILDRLQVNKKRILLSQKSNVRVPPIDEGGENRTIYEDNESYFKDLLVLDTRNASNVIPFLGQIGINSSVNYIDFFNPIFLHQTQFPPIPLQSNETDAEPLPYHGFSLNDNFPMLDFSSENCPSPKSFIQSYFTERLLTTSDNSVNTSSLWGTVCPLYTVHNLNLSSSGFKRHLGLHNVYGEQSLKIVYKTVMERDQSSKDEMLLTSGSFWTASLYYGAYNGMQTPFTWKGLQESVTNIVRNYAMAPISGTSICGGSLRNNVTFPKNSDLCLRWFQFGLLLPFARNSYDSESSYGPFDFSDQFRLWLNDSIIARYSYAPYYYTELLKYQMTFVPLVRPMSFDFNRRHERNETMHRLTQFMIGDALFAAPIIDRGVTRSAYFPAGVWYGMDGQVVWNNSATGEEKQITGLITQTPLFIRGGYMIPTLQEPITAGTIEESLKGKYKLLAALTSSMEVVRTATGTLTVKEPNSNNTHHVNFATTVSTTTDGKFLMVINVNSTCGSDDGASPNLSTLIDEVRIYGLSYLGSLHVTVKSSNGIGSADVRYVGEHTALRLFNMGMDWCKASEYEVTVMQKIDEETTTTNEPEIPTTDQISTETITEVSEAATTDITTE